MIMTGQMTIWDIPLNTEPSKCYDCYYMCLGKCACWHSKYEDMDVPQNGCEWFDGISGGIPDIKELTL